MMKLEGIDGTTRLYGIMGDPIAAVRSPEVFNAMFAQENINAVLVPLHVAPGDIEAAWRGLAALQNLSGLVVTMPHKARLLPLLDSVGLAGQLVGAVNAVRREPDGRWHGEMFDGAGFVDGLRSQGHAPEGWHVRLHGLGGAGVAIAVALAQAGVGRLDLRDLDAARVQAIAGKLHAHFPAVRLTTDAGADAEAQGALDAAINATPLGMNSIDPLPFDPTALPPGTLVVDVITKPEMTPLLHRAAGSGHRVHTGKHMHLGQARRAAAFFGFQLP